MRRIFFACLVLLLSSGTASATLCAKCKEMKFEARVGKCVECAGVSCSPTWKLCNRCSAKLGECACCRAKLATAKKEEEKPEPVDTGKSGTYTSDNWRYVYTITAKGTWGERRKGALTYDGKPIPDSQRLDRISTPWGIMQYFGDVEEKTGGGWLLKKVVDKPIDATRGRMLPHPAEAVAGLKILEENLDDFALDLHYHGSQDKPFYALTLATKPELKDPMGFHLYVPIDKDQAKKIVGWLFESGLLGRSRAISPVRRAKVDPPKAPGYRITLSAGGWVFYDDLGWGPALLKDLDALRSKLDGDAAKKMDLLLGRLAGLRKRWEAEAKRAAKHQKQK